MSEAPEIIYLQVHPDDADEGGPDFESGDVTWCIDPIHETDIEYVRADRIEELEELVEELKGLLMERGKEAYRLRQLIQTRRYVDD